MGILEIPKQMDFADHTPSGSVPPSSNTTKILVEDRVFDIKDSTITSSVLRKLQSTEGGLYRFSDKWDVRAAQFSVLLDYVQSGK